LGRDETASVLVIEDNENESRVLRRRLARRGLFARVAGTVREAEQALSAQKFKVIVLDLLLPEADGKQLMLNNGEDILATLRGGKLGLLNSQTPVVVYTAHEAGLDRNKFIEEYEPAGLYAKLEQGRALSQVELISRSNLE